MKIAYVSVDRGVPVFGEKGCSLHVQEVLRTLLDQGHDCSLFSAAMRGSAPRDLADLPVYKIARERTDNRNWREWADLRANADVAAQIGAQGPFDLVYERYSLWSYAAMEFAQAAGIPGVLEVNAPLIEEQARYRGLCHPAAAEEVARRCFAAATVLVAVSQGVADYLDRYPETHGKVHVVPNGVNPNRFVMDDATPRDDNRVTIGFVGTLKPWHGVAGLVDAFATLHRRYPQTRLLLVGDGPERDAVEEQVAWYELASAVEMAGAVQPELIPDYLQRMDLGVAPYPADPAFYFSPLKIYEYMAAGLPVVASRIGQVAELVEDGRSGLLYTPGDLKGLVEAMAKIVANPMLAADMRRVGRDCVERHHSWHARVEQILALAFDSASSSGRLRGIG